MLSGNKVLFLELEEAQPSLVLTLKALRAPSPLGRIAWLFSLILSLPPGGKTAAWCVLGEGTGLWPWVGSISWAAHAFQPSQWLQFSQLRISSGGAHPVVPHWPWQELPCGCPLTELFVLLPRIRASSCTANAKAFGHT